MYIYTKEYYSAMRMKEILPFVTWMDLAAATAKWLQSCPTLCDPMDCSPPGSSEDGP